MQRAKRSKLTALEASHKFGLPLPVVWRAFVWGLPDLVAPIGRPDEWSVWWASAQEADRVLGSAGRARQIQGRSHSWQERTVARIARRQRLSQDEPQ